MPAELRPAGVGGGNVQTSGFILIAFVAGTLLGGLTFSSHIAPTAHDYEHVDQTGTLG